jgi:hypothetical protein
MGAPHRSGPTACFRPRIEMVRPQPGIAKPTDADAASTDESACEDRCDDAFNSRRFVEVGDPGISNGFRLLDAFTRVTTGSVFNSDQSATG